MLILWLGCLGTAPDSSAPDETGAVDSADPFCVDAPVVRWTNFGESFITHSCQGCHATVSPDRHGAPDEVDFDSLERVWEQQWLILGVAAGEAPTMPPEGGVDPDDRVRLEWWLRCAPEGT